MNIKAGKQPLQRLQSEAANQPTAYGDAWPEGGPLRTPQATQKSQTAKRVVSVSVAARGYAHINKVTKWT